MEDTTEKAPIELHLPMDQILNVMAAADPTLFEMAKQTVRGNMLEQMLMEARGMAPKPSPDPQLDLGLEG